MYSCHTFLQGPGKCLVFRFISIILYYLKKDSQETIPETESLAGGSQDLFLNPPASIRNDRTDEISKILYINIFHVFVLKIQNNTINHTSVTLYVCCIAVNLGTVLAFYYYFFLDLYAVFRSLYIYKKKKLLRIEAKTRHVTR